MTRKTLALTALALVTLAMVPVLAGAQGAGNTTASNYTLAELEDAGTHPGGPDSVRYLGDYGSATVRYDPVGPLSGSWQYLTPGELIHDDEVRLRTVRLSPPSQIDRTLNVTVVSWHRETREVVRGNETIEVPAPVNVTERRQQVTLGRGYQNATIDLPHHYDEDTRVTMWVEEYPDARWTFMHRSVPGTQAVDIDTKEDAWAYASGTTAFPGALGILFGLLLSHWVLKRAHSGPRLGLFIWVLAAGIGLALILSALYFQVSVVLAYFPWMIGGVLGLLAFGGHLWLSGSPAKILLMKPILSDARVSPTARDRISGAAEAENKFEWAGGEEPIADGGQVVSQPKEGGHSPGSGLDEIHELLFVAVGELPAIRNPAGVLGVPKKGIRPWLARMWSDSATLDKSDLMTEIALEDLDEDLPTTGYDEMLLLDPEGEGPEYTASRFERRMPFLHRFDLEDEDAGWVRKVAALGGAALLVLGLPLAGYAVGMEAGVPFLGGAAGLVPAVIESYGTKDGKIDYDPAAQHFQDAWGTLADLQREQADAKTMDSVREERDKERMRTAKEVMEAAEQTDETMAGEVVGEVVRVPLDGGGDRTNGEKPHPDAGGEDGDDE